MIDLSPPPPIRTAWFDTHSGSGMRYAAYAALSAAGGAGCGQPSVIFSPPFGGDISVLGEIFTKYLPQMVYPPQMNLPPK